MNLEGPRVCSFLPQGEDDAMACRPGHWTRYVSREASLSFQSFSPLVLLTLRWAGTVTMSDLPAQVLLDLC